jgi:hypothetical protein
VKPAPVPGKTRTRSKGTGFQSYGLRVSGHMLLMTHVTSPAHWQLQPQQQQQHVQQQQQQSQHGGVGWTRRGHDKDVKGGMRARDRRVSNPR